MDYEEFGPCGTSLFFADEADFLDKISRVDTFVPGRTEGRQSWHEERYCIVHYLQHLQAENLLKFPLEVESAEAPDFLLRFQTGLVVGIEHTNFGTEEFHLASAKLEQQPEGSMLEASSFDLAGNPKNVMSAIKLPGETLNGPGWAGNEAEHQWAELANRAIKRKRVSLNKSHHTICDRNELLLYDNTHLHLGSSVELALKILIGNLKDNRETSDQSRGFDAVSVFHQSDVFIDVFSDVTSSRTTGIQLEAPH